MSDTSARNRGVMRVLGIVLAAGSLAGCSFSYKDAQGHAHRIGVMDVEVSDPGSYRASSITTIGLALISNDIHSGVSLGYTTESLGYLHNNEQVFFTNNSTGGNK